MPAQVSGPLEGRVALLGAPESTEEVTIDLAAETIVLRSPSGLIGVWGLDEVVIQVEEDGFLLTVEGDHLVLATGDDPAFARAVGLAAALPLPAQAPDRNMPAQRPVVRSAGDLFR